jgi:hypothetical protein
MVNGTNIDLKALIDGMLSSNMSKRLTINQVVNSVWLAPYIKEQAVKLVAPRTDSGFSK